MMKTSRMRATSPLMRVLVLVMGALLLAACGSSDETTPTATSAPDNGSAATRRDEEATSFATSEATAASDDAGTPAATPATTDAAATPGSAMDATPEAPGATAVAGPEGQGTPAASPEAPGGTVVSSLGCWDEDPSWDAGYPQWSNAPEMKIDPDTEYTAVIETNRGTIVTDLYADVAPTTVNNFICLATEGYFDGVTFHRVMNDFMIQTGDPTGTGRGGPGYQLEDELPGGGLDYDRGVLAMANAGPNTNGSQFFINQANNADRLDKSYTIFGKVTDGMDVVDRIAQMPVSASDQGEESVPAATVTVLSVEIEER